MDGSSQKTNISGMSKLSDVRSWVGCTPEAITSVQPSPAKSFSHFPVSQICFDNVRVTGRNLPRLSRRVVSPRLNERPEETEDLLFRSGGELPASQLQPDRTLMPTPSTPPFPLRNLGDYLRTRKIFRWRRFPGKSIPEQNIQRVFSSGRNLKSIGIGGGIQVHVNNARLGF
jgi:hypothetical protein